MNQVKGFRAFFQSTIGAKVLMAVSGFFLVFFVVQHLVGNLQVYLGRDAFNGYAAFMQNLGKLLWVVRGGLLAMLILHVLMAIRLANLNRSARPQSYRKPHVFRRSTYAARFMLLSGIVVLLFLIYHLLHFTFGVIQPDNFNAYEVLMDGRWIPASNLEQLQQLPKDAIRHDAYSMFITGFYDLRIALFYIAANIAVALHLHHAIFSMLSSLGLVQGRYRRPVEYVSPAIAGFILIGNLSFPLAVQAGILTL